jgi:hypothetical protein
VSIVRRLTDNFTFQFITSKALLSHSLHNEWVVDSGWTHHMAKDATLFMSLEKVVERNIYVVD